MIEFPCEHVVSAFADWLEATLLFTNSKRLSRADIEGIFDQIGVLDGDDHISNLLREIDRRTKSIGVYYPLELERMAISRKKRWRESLVYSFQLLISLNRHYPILRFRGKAAHKPAELFEFLTLHAFQRYLKGECIRIGAPRRPPIPRSFIKAVNYVCNLTSERFGGGDLNRSNILDEDLDVIGWSPFRDLRSGQLLLFGQCAIGIDWDDKLKDLCLNQWNEHIRWLVKPVRAFAVPFIHDDGEAWLRTSREGGLIFDRARISSLLRPNDLPRDLASEIKEWCEARIESLLGLEL